MNMMLVLFTGMDRENMEDQSNGTVDIPLSIKHANLMLLSIVLLLLLIVISLVLSMFASICFLFVFIGSILSYLLVRIYNQMKRYARIVKALYMELIEVKVLKESFFEYGILKIKTLRHGEFFLINIPDRGHPGMRSIYKLWIVTDKKIPVKEGEKRYLWKKMRRQKKGTIVEQEFAHYISQIQLDPIKSLHRIQFEIEGGENRIAALFYEIMLYSETNDILRTLEALRDIEKMI
jgi:hypothetical protein